MNQQCDPNAKASRGQGSASVSGGGPGPKKKPKPKESFQLPTVILPPRVPPVEPPGGWASGLMKRLAEWVGGRAGTALAGIGVFVVAVLFPHDAGVTNEWAQKLPDEEEARWRELEKKRRELAREGKVLPVQEYEEWLALDERTFPYGRDNNGPRPRKKEDKESRQDLIDKLRSKGVKFDETKIVSVRRDANGKIIFLEEGNAKAGLEHIMRHANEFKSKGIDQDEIADVVLHAVATGRQVGTQGTRPVYEITYEGKKMYIAVTVGSNGFIVGANPTSKP